MLGGGFYDEVFLSWCLMGRGRGVLQVREESFCLDFCQTVSLSLFFFLNTDGILREFKRIPGKGLQTSLSDMVEGPCLERSFLETVGRWGWGWGRMGIAGKPILSWQLQLPGQSPQAALLVR